MASNIVRMIADRFGITSGDDVVDLATGSPVVLKMDAGGDAAEQARWSLRCDALYRLHHPRLATLLDYGALGTSERFEAWQAGPPWRWSEACLERTRRGAARVLAAAGLSGSPGAAADVREFDVTPVFVPSTGCGYPRESATAPPASAGPAGPALQDCAMVTVDRRADTLLDDLFASVTGTRPHVVSVWGAPGSGRTTLVRRACRTARLHGFIPVSARALAQLDWGLLKDRQVCLIVEHPLRWTSALLTLTAASPRAHVVVQLGVEEAAGMRSISLEPIPSGTLEGAVRPVRLGDRARAEVRRLARLSRGLPGRFARRLWSEPGRPSQAVEAGRLRRTVRVAERQPAYGEAQIPPSGEVVSSSPRPAGEWPTSAEMVALRHRAEAAGDLIRQGRHAPGVRQLRQAIGALVRRNDHAHASGGMIVLASALLTRGDARGALTVLDQAHACAERAGVDQALVDIATVTSHAWTDLARLNDAEGAAGAALAVARRLGDGPRTAAAAVALGRCLFWKGQYAEALSAVTAAEAHSSSPAPLVASRVVAARALVGLGDLAQATARAREAQDEASRSDADPRRLAQACRGAALVHLSLGDLDALEADVGRAIAAARAAHDPMSGIRARLLQVESQRRRARRASPARFVRLARRLASTHLPPLLRARLDLIHDLIQSPERVREVVAQHVSRTGLGALPIYAGLHRWPAAAPLSDPAEQIIGILDLCQTALDETQLLGEVCARLRGQLRAVSVAVFGREATTVVAVAHDGPRLEADIALRAMDASSPIAPHQLRDRLEAAVPVRYGGIVIGAVVARWVVGTPYDLSPAVGVLMLAATAAAPVLSAASARRAHAPGTAVPDLVGATPVMCELRRAIERAAKAPFTVLIEGESGSGKELVAKAVHRMGLNRDRPFCTLNCAALPEDLVEAELFGHARGAFTGAIHERAGVFEEANGGTLLLDEVGELSLRAQAKLLRVIQEGELRRIGENHARRVEVRVVAATNRDLRREVGAGRFRLDLLYRLDVIRLEVPPLRDRREDIALLAQRFWQDATRKIASRAVLAAATVAGLARYDWPGNVRELQNVLAALAVRTPRRGVVPPTALPPQFGAACRADACRLDDARRVFEERFVRAALVRSGGHRARAAAELGVTRQGLTKLMARLGI